jgi:hypothetical protein
VRSELLVGNRNTGTASVTLGARMQAGKLTLGGFAGGEGFLSVENASLEVLGDTVIGAGGSGSVDVRGLAVAVFNGPTDLARDADGTASIAISRGASATATPTADFRDTLRIGVAGGGDMLVEAGGLARVLRNLSLGGLLASADGRIELRGAADPASLEVTGDIVLGEFLGDGELTMFGRAFVKANRIVLGPAGLHTTRPGSIVQANVVNGGAFSATPPGPGKQDEAPALIEGNLEMLPGGTLRIEAAPGTPALNITGDATLGGTLEITFPEGFDPDQGQVFSLFEVQGATLGDFESIVAPNRDGFAAALGTEDGTIRLTVTEPGSAADPEGEGEVDGEGDTEGETPPPAGGGCGGCGGCEGSAKDALQKHLGDWLLAAAVGFVLLILHRRSRHSATSA